MYRTNRQPLGHVTRGKTAAYRLRRLDRFLLDTEESLIRRTDGCFVDLGYGWRPTTTMETAACLRAIAPDLLVVGFEIEPERVEAADQVTDERTRFRRGGFDLPLLPDERPALIRAMNVLRQYPEDAVSDAHAQLRERLIAGGVCVEGTSTPSGHRMVVNRFGPGRDPTIVFLANLRHPLQSPTDFAAILPKNHIHRMVPGEPVFGLLSDWETAWRTTQPASTFGPLAHWCAAGRELARIRTDVRWHRARLRRGVLEWCPP